MILKKPYAFLIKYFKLIHGILLVLMIYLLYRTNLILNFFQEYIASEQLITGKDFTGQIFNSWMFIFPFIIIAVLLILLWVMIYKKKNKMFYIYNVLIMVAIVAFYNIGHNVLDILEGQTIETRTLRLLRDLYVIVILFQGIGVIFTFIRATGFDIKKFDFSTDLEQMDITEADNEEFEVDVNFETNIARRELRKRIRSIKYIYIENKFILNILFLIAVSVVCFTIYMNLTIYNKTYNQEQTFMANDFMMSITNSYLTNQNHKGSKITDDYLLIVELNVKSNYDDKAKFNTTKAGVKIKGDTYYPINKYNFKLTDLGTIYKDIIISQSDFQKILLVYEIPKAVINKKMILNYVDSVEMDGNKLNTNYIKVKLNPYNLDSEEKTEKAELNKVVKLNEQILGSTSLYLTEFEIQERFKVNYNHCISGKCYDSIEYLNPNLNTNYDKVLLKIDGIANMDKTLNNKNIYDLYTLINYFGKIKYVTLGRTHYYKNLNRISLKKTTLNNTCYVEIPKAVMSADKISFIIDVRDVSYEYVIK